MPQSLTVQSKVSNEPADKQVISKLYINFKNIQTWFANHFSHKEALKTSFSTNCHRRFQQTRMQTKLNFENLLSKAFLMHINNFLDVGRKIRFSKRYHQFVVSFFYHRTVYIFILFVSSSPKSF